RLADVGGGVVPHVATSGGRRQVLPALVPFEDLAVGGGEHGRLERTLDRALDLGARGPDVLQEDGTAVAARSQRFGIQIDVHRARERVGDDEWRGGEVVHAHVATDSAFEV